MGWKSRRRYSPRALIGRTARAALKLALGEQRTSTLLGNMKRMASRSLAVEAAASLDVLRRETQRLELALASERDRSRAEDRLRYYERWELQSRLLQLQIRVDLHEHPRPIRVVDLVFYEPWLREGLIDALAGDERFAFTAVVLPYLLDGCFDVEGYFACLTALERRGVSMVEGYDFASSQYRNVDIRGRLRPDVLFVDAPYVHLPPHDEVTRLGIPIPTSVMGAPSTDFALLAYTPYALTTIDEILASRIAYNGVNFHHDLPVHNLAWRYFCETEWHREHGSRHSAIQGRNRVVAGCPKLDPLFDEPRDTDEAAWRIPRHERPDIKRLIWAPHHNARPSVSGIPPLRFFELKDFFLDFARKHPDVEVVFKPHPLLRTRCIRRYGVPESEVDAYYAAWETLPNGQLHRGTYMDLFRSSDVMVTDSGSFHTEYFFTGKPLVSLGFPDGFNGFAQTIHDVQYQPQNLAELQALLDAILWRGEDPQREARAALASRVDLIRESGSFIRDYLLDALYGPP